MPTKLDSAAPSPPWTPALSREEAVHIAVAAANEAAPGHDYTAQAEHAEERIFGWVVHVAPRKYFETKDSSYLIPGVGAIVVDRRTRVATLLPSSQSPAEAIKEIEKEWIPAKPR